MKTNLTPRFVVFTEEDLKPLGNWVGRLKFNAAFECGLDRKGNQMLGLQMLDRDDLMPASRRGIIIVLNDELVVPATKIARARARILLNRGKKR